MFSRLKVLKYLTFNDAAKLTGLYRGTLHREYSPCIEFEKYTGLFNPLIRVDKLTSNVVYGRHVVHLMTTEFQCSFIELIDLLQYTEGNDIVYVGLNTCG